jgi:hypothetical protein
VDTNFFCRVWGSHGVINTTLVDRDGNIWIGGAFTIVNNLPRSCIAKLFGAEQIAPPHVLGPFRSDAGFGVQVETVVNRTYQLQATSSLPGFCRRPRTALAIGSISSVTGSKAHRRLTGWDRNILVLPTEIAKIYMDEHTGNLYDERIEALRKAGREVIR